MASRLGSLMPPTSPLRFSFFAVAALLASMLVGCVVKDEMKDGLREMRGEIVDTRLDRRDDGSGRVSFTFQYGIALVDDQGVSPFPWRYRLVDRDRHVVAEHSQDMRDAEPGKTRVLVTGERTRFLDVPAGGLREGETYILWVEVDYREERLFEVLASVGGLAGEAWGADGGWADAGTSDAGFTDDLDATTSTTSVQDSP